MEHPLADHLTLEEELLIKTADPNTEEVDKVKQPTVYVVAGEKHAPGEKCPACHRCKKKGHFKAQGLSKTVAETELGAAFLGTLTPKTESAWMATIRLERKEIQFKLDTGAGVTAISEKTYQKLRGKRLQRAPRPICGPASLSRSESWARSGVNLPTSRSPTQSRCMSYEV